MHCQLCIEIYIMCIYIYIQEYIDLYGNRGVNSYAYGTAVRVSYDSVLHIFKYIIVILFIALLSTVKHIKKEYLLQ